MQGLQDRQGGEGLAQSVNTHARSARGRDIRVLHAPRTHYSLTQLIGLSSGTSSDSSKLDLTEIHAEVLKISCSL